MKIQKALVALFCALFISQTSYCQTKYPDYADIFLGKDKYENLNRKIFIFNSKLNKYALKPMHILWSSIMPKYGIDRLEGIQNNIEYPRRVISGLIQKDFKACKSETIRFITNTTIGLGGMFDPAKKFLKIEPVTEDMEQALTKLKVKQGSYLVLPVASSTSTRGAVGKALDGALDPTIYLGSPIIGMIKAGLFVNKTSFMQPLIKALENTYIDPYDIAKKLYGVENYIKNHNLDREKLVKNQSKENILEVSEIKESVELKPDIELENFQPQCPITDSMRTAFFENDEKQKSIWNELSLWNRTFEKKIKTNKIEITKGREKYHYNYLLQKNKKAPLAIIYPSIGEHSKSHHSLVLAKIFYDEGYSILMQGSHFHWEFIKSMPANYRPGLPDKDSAHLRKITKMAIEDLEKRKNIKFEKKLLIGTSFGAMMTLFIAKHEEKEKELNITKYISINPPIELYYALKKLDANNNDWVIELENIKENVAKIASKVIKIAKLKKEDKYKLGTLPFNEYESKLITNFVLRQKLSDLIFQIENAPKHKSSNIYEKINNTSFYDYLANYIQIDEKELVDNGSLHLISNYLINNDNYRVYHSLDDYFTNKEQLTKLKEYTKENSKYFSHGGHLGFLYRDEFLKELKKDISLDENKNL